MSGMRIPELNMLKRNREDPFFLTSQVLDSKQKQKPFVKYAELGRDHIQLPCDLCTRTWLNLGYP